MLMPFYGTHKQPQLQHRDYSDLPLNTDGTLLSIIFKSYITLLYTFDDPLRKTRTKYNRVVSVVDKWMKKVHRLCPYLDTINRQVLDFDFEKLCSVSLSRINVYACLVCGKYFQGKVLIYNIIILHSKQIAGHVSMCVCIFRGLVPIGDNLP